MVRSTLLCRLLWVALRATRTPCRTYGFFSRVFLFFGVVLGVWPGLPGSDLDYFCSYVVLNTCLFDIYAGPRDSSVRRFSRLKLFAYGG